MRLFEAFRIKISGDIQVLELNVILIFNLVIQIN